MKVASLSQLKIGDVVEVLWRDATGHSGWERRRDMEPPKDAAVSHGIFAGCDKERMTLCSDAFEDFESDDGTLGGKRTIPRAMVIEVRVLHRLSKRSFERRKR